MLLWKIIWEPRFDQKLCGILLLKKKYNFIEEFLNPDYKSLQTTGSLTK